MAFTLTDVTKEYPGGVLANAGVSFSLQTGEILGLFGPNGAGKSTLVKQMVGLLSPSSGSITLFDKDVRAYPGGIARHVAYLGQSESGLGSLTFREIIVHAGVHRGLGARDAAKEAEILIEHFRCQAIANRLRLRLSGGERKLSLFLACLIAQRPVMVLDEPTNELDPAHRALVWEYLHTLTKSKGISILLVTHNVVEAETVVDRVAVIDKGKLCALGTPGELKAEFGDVAHVELSVKPGYEAYLPPHAKRIHGQTYRLLTPQREAPRVFTEFVERAGFAAIDDFRITTVSLADVYARLVGGHQ